MNEKKIREELYEFYLYGDAEREKKFADKCFDIMDRRNSSGRSKASGKISRSDCPRYRILARFTSLSHEWQQEVITRNFYD